MNKTRVKPTRQVRDHQSHPVQTSLVFPFFTFPQIVLLKVLLRRGAEIKVTSGLRNMRIIKTTQSSFSNFVDDAYRTLPDTNDRAPNDCDLTYANKNFK